MKEEKNPHINYPSRSTRKAEFPFEETKTKQRKKRDFVTSCVLHCRITRAFASDAHTRQNFPLKLLPKCQKDVAVKNESKEVVNVHFYCQLKHCYRDVKTHVVHH